MHCSFRVPVGTFSLQTPLKHFPKLPSTKLILSTCSNVPKGGGKKEKEDDEEEEEEKEDGG